jgi:hypothetical protein
LTQASQTKFSDSGEIFVPRDINGKRSDCKLVVGHPDSKIAGGVMGEFEK